MKQPSLLLVLLLLCFTTLSAHGYQLLPIIGISKSSKTFSTNIGAQAGLQEGMEATFSNSHVSIVARALKVSGDESVWEVVGVDALVPFAKNEIVTFNYATERIWMMDPDQYLTFKEKQLAEERYQQALLARQSYSNVMTLTRSVLQGVSQTVSQTDSSTITDRSGSQMELFYGRNLAMGLQLGLGVRYENELIRALTYDAQSERIFLLGRLAYYANPLLTWPNLYFFGATTVGSGQSQTTFVQQKIVGQATLFPSIDAGLEYFLWQRWGIAVRGGFETVSTQEKYDDGSQIDTSAVNSFVGVAVSYLWRWGE